MSSLNIIGSYLVKSIIYIGEFAWRNPRLATFSVVAFLLAIITLRYVYYYKVTKVLAIDCTWPSTDLPYYRIVIMNNHHRCIFDISLKLTEPYVDRPKFNVQEDMEVVKTRVENLIRGKILVGIDVEKQLENLNISHPKPLIRDLKEFPPYTVDNLYLYDIFFDDFVEGKYDIKYCDCRTRASFSLRCYKYMQPQWELNEENDLQLSVEKDKLEEAKKNVAEEPPPATKDLQTSEEKEKLDEAKKNVAEEPPPATKDLQTSEEKEILDEASLWRIRYRRPATIN